GLGSFFSSALREHSWGFQVRHPCRFSLASQFLWRCFLPLTSDGARSGPLSSASTSGSWQPYRRGDGRALAFWRFTYTVFSPHYLLFQLVLGTWQSGSPRHGSCSGLFAIHYSRLLDGL